jgi:hypothetical protein
VNALRLATWIDRHRRSLLVGSLLLLVASGWLASRLPVYGDFSHLLPPNAPSVVQLHELEGRIQSFGGVMVVVESDDPGVRGRATAALVARLDKIDPQLVAQIAWQNRETRQWIWKNRFLFAPIDDLKEAKTALAERLKKAKLEANPLYVDLEDKDEKAAAAQDERLDALRKKLKEAEEKRDGEAGFVSKDGKMQLVVVRAPFDSSAVDLTSRLVDELARAKQATEAEFPQAHVTATGDLYTALAEHRALLNGMLLAIIITVTLVAIGLLLYYRSLRGVSVLMWSLAVGTALTFAVTKLTIGSLNLATAFLSSIVVGNGINFGIVLLARHLEERRNGVSGVPAIAAAISGTLRGTGTAALTASIAYGSLILTDFKGFKHFGIIGGIGMVLCWVAAYTFIPAGLAILERTKTFGPRREPALGRILVKLLPKRFGWVVAASAAGLLAAGAITLNYLVHDPWEHSVRRLRSETAELDQARAMIGRINVAFGNDITGGFVIAVRDRDGARRVVKMMRDTDKQRTKEAALFQNIRGLDDILPPGQDEKLVLLGDIRKMIDQALPDLSEADRRDIEKLRPPDELHALGDSDVPNEIAWPFTERDGTRGRLILADASDNYDTWNINSLIAFADEVRKLDLGEGVALGGSMFVFADVLRSMEGDGPRATVAATIGAVLIVLLLVGLGRHGWVTLLCGLSGTVWMIAGCSLLGLKVNFLDFVALPITIGIGIDYAVNIAARSKADGAGSALRSLATTGSAVTLCSFTTMVGYGSLLQSASGGIRSFGAAATLGEVTCLLTALTLAPALLALLDGKRAATVNAPDEDEPRRAAG